MVKIGFSEQDCIDYMRNFIERIDNIIGLFDSHGWIPFEKREYAQMLLSDLKLSLKENYLKRDTRYGEKLMTQVEKHYFFRAIHQASTDIHIKTNSIPSEKWISELSIARYSISYYLENLVRISEK